MDLTILYPKSYSIFLRGTIALSGDVRDAIFFWGEGRGVWYFLGSSAVLVYLVQTTPKPLTGWSLPGGAGGGVPPLVA